MASRTSSTMSFDKIFQESANKDDISIFLQAYNSSFSCRNVFITQFLSECVKKNATNCIDYLLKNAQEYSDKLDFEAEICECYLLFNTREAKNSIQFSEIVLLSFSLWQQGRLPTFTTIDLLFYNKCDDIAFKIIKSTFDYYAKIATKPETDFAIFIEKVKEELRSILSSDKNSSQIKEITKIVKKSVSVEPVFRKVVIRLIKNINYRNGRKSKKTNIYLSKTLQKM